MSQSTGASLSMVCDGMNESARSNDLCGGHYEHLSCPLSLRHHRIIANRTVCKDRRFETFYVKRYLVIIDGRPTYLASNKGYMTKNEYYPDDRVYRSKQYILKEMTNNK